MSNPFPSAPPVATPCVGVCRLDAQGHCIGCRRTLHEIGRWRDMSEAERLYVMRDVLPLRKQS